MFPKTDGLIENTSIGSRGVFAYYKKNSDFYLVSVDIGDDCDITNISSFEAKSA